MVYLSKKKYHKKHTTKKNKTKKNKLKEHFLHNKKDDSSKPNIKECNKIMIKKEDNCQCLDKKGYPSRNFKDCIKKKKSNCSEYNTCKNIFSKFMSGDEPKYEPHLWESPYIQGSHNCYTYFLDDRIDSIKKECHKKCLQKQKKDKKAGKKVTKCPPNKGTRIEKCGDLKPQPGDYAYEMGNISNINNVYTCKEMQKKFLEIISIKKINQLLIVSSLTNLVLKRNIKELL